MDVVRIISRERKQCIRWRSRNIHIFNSVYLSEWYARYALSVNLNECNAIYAMNEIFPSQKPAVPTADSFVDLVGSLSTPLADSEHVMSVWVFRLNTNLFEHLVVGHLVVFTVPVGEESQIMASIHVFNHPRRASVRGRFRTNIIGGGLFDSIFTVTA